MEKIFPHVSEIDIYTSISDHRNVGFQYKNQLEYQTIFIPSYIYIYINPDIPLFQSLIRYYVYIDIIHHKYS